MKVWQESMTRKTSKKINSRDVVFFYRNGMAREGAAADLIIVFLYRKQMTNNDEADLECH